MYALRREALSWEPIAGVPWRDMSDEEFAAVEAAYDAQFAEKGALSRFFEHVVEEAGGSRAKKSSAGSGR